MEEKKGLTCTTPVGIFDARSGLRRAELNEYGEKGLKFGKEFENEERRAAEFTNQERIWTPSSCLYFLVE